MKWSFQAFDCFWDLIFLGGNLTFQISEGIEFHNIENILISVRSLRVARSRLQLFDPPPEETRQRSGRKNLEDDAGISATEQHPFTTPGPSDPANKASVMPPIMK